MPKRREIREAAIQFLYCADLEGGPDPSALNETFWDFITESDRRSLLLASFRTIHHLSQGRASRVEEFSNRRQEAISRLAAWPEAEALTRELSRMAALESKWSAILDSMCRLSKDGDDSEIVERFGPPLSELFLADRALTEARSAFLSKSEDFPQLKSHLEPVAGSIRRLQRISERVRMVEEPENFPDQADIASLRQSKSQIRALRDAVTPLIDRILANKEAIDQQLADIVDNYTPERIDPVDRAILRLAAQEIMQGDTPHKVVINEAIELAKRFGTSDSGRFVNGILDRLASKHGIHQD